MLSKGIIMLLIGGVGLVLTIVWILVDLANRSKREEKIIKKAAENSASIPIRRSEGTGQVNFTSNEEVSIPRNSEIDSKMNNQESDTLVDSITEMELTEILVEESTEILTETNILDNEEELTEILINEETKDNIMP